MIKAIQKCVVLIYFITNYFLLFISLVNGTPTFTRIDCTRYRGYNLCLRVDYDGGREDDIMLLKRVGNEETVFEGHLLYERNRVAVTIEDISNPDDIDVKFCF